MRISTLHIYNIANNSMSDVNRELTRTQEQLSTGRRVLTPADDPVASTRIQQLNVQLSSVSQYEKNITIAQNNLKLEETVLESINNLVQRMKEVAVQAGNTAVYTPGDYQALASEVDTRLNELFDLVNSRNANGDYIFAGFQGGQPAFSGDPINGYRYEGDEGQVKIKISDTTTIATSDSGKALFSDINTGLNTIKTSASSSNRSIPPVTISLGEVVDQNEFDSFYPEDMIITFNADTDVSPPGKNFTVTEKSTGKVIDANRRFLVGEELVYKGVAVRIAGSPVSGTPAVPATRDFGVESALSFPVNFGATNATVDIRVGSRIETFILDANVTNTTDLAAIFNNVGNGNSAKLANLGLTVDSGGFSHPQGVNFFVENGNAQVQNVTGLNVVTGSSSTDGVRAVNGDQLFIESTNKQDILTTLARFSQVMNNFDGSVADKEKMSAIVGATLSNLSFTERSISEVVTQIGARVNTLDSTLEAHADTRLINQTILSDLQDVDYAEAATRLSTQTMILQAAQATFIQVSRLSLFERL